LIRGFGDLRGPGETIPIELEFDSRTRQRFAVDDDLIRLAQYELTSLAATRQKLAQFPRGTSFTLYANSIDPPTASSPN
jgi:hypothetical protein